MATDMQTLNDERLKAASTAGAPQAYIDEVKSTLMFSLDWHTLLASVPFAITLLGSCFVATHSPLVIPVTITRAPNAKLNSDSLRASLLQVCDAGRMSFLNAQLNMSLLNVRTEKLGEWLTTISQLMTKLPDDTAVHGINTHLEYVQIAAGKCLDLSTETEGHFRDWLVLVMELHEAVTNKQTLNANEKAKIDQQLTKLNIEANMQQTSLKDINDTVETMRKQVRTTQDAWESTAAKMPSRFQSAVGDVVSTLSACTSVIFSQNYSQIMDLVKLPPGTATTRLNADVPDQQDPAYAVAGGIKLQVQALYDLFGCKDQSAVAWDKLQADTNATSSNSSLSYIEATLDMRARPSELGSGTASVSLGQAATKALDQIQAVDAILSSQTLQDLPGKDDPAVKKWQDAFTSLHTVVTDLNTKSASFPGGTPSLAPGIDSAGGQSRGALAGIQDNTTASSLRQTEQAFLTAQASMLHAQEQRMAMQADIAKVKAELDSLQLHQADLTQIRLVLNQVIAVLVTVKEQVSNLARFFAALSSMVENLIKSTLVDYTAQVKNIERVEIAGHSLSTITRQMMYTATLNAAAWFELASDIAGMYSKVSNDQVVKGLQLCDALSMAELTQDEVVAARRKLDDWGAASQKEVSDVAQQTQERLTSGLKSRILEVQKQVQMLPAPAVTVQTVIAGAGQAAQQHIGNAITEQITPISFSAYSLDD